MSAKSQALAHDIADELKKRLAFLSTTILLTEGADSNGDATISISDATPATTEKNVFIRVKALDWNLGTNAVGLTAEVFSPSIVQIATEAVATNGTFLSPDDLFQLLGTCLSRGARTEWWQETNGTVPTVTTFNTAAKLKSTWNPTLYGNMRASQ